MEEIREYMRRITGRNIDESFRMFLPFYTDFGKNIRIGGNVFINACCCFQDQGGISIGDGTLIGHRVVIATINHGLRPEGRMDHHIAPVRVGRNVWIGSGSILLPGVTIGDGATVAAEGCPRRRRGGRRAGENSPSALRVSQKPEGAQRHQRPTGKSIGSSFPALPPATDRKTPFMAGCRSTRRRFGRAGLFSGIWFPAEKS